MDNYKDLSSNNLTTISNLNHHLNFTDASALLDGQKGSGKTEILKYVNSPTIDAKIIIDAKEKEAYSKIKSFLFPEVNPDGIKLSELYNKVGVTKTSLIMLDNAMSLDNEYLEELIKTWNSNKSLLRLILADVGVSTKVKNLNIKEISYEKLNTFYLEALSKDEAINLLISKFPEVQGANMAMVEKNISKIALYPGNIINLGHRIVKHADKEFVPVPEASNVITKEDTSENNLNLEGLTASRDYMNKKENNKNKNKNTNTLIFTAITILSIIAGTYFLTNSNNETSLENQAKIDAIRERIKNNEQKVEKLKQTQTKIEEAAKKNEFKKQENKVPVVKSLDELKTDTDNNEEVNFEFENVTDSNEAEKEKRFEELKKIQEEKLKRQAEEKRIAEAKAKAEKEAKEKAEKEAEEKSIAEAKAKAEKEAKEKAEKEAEEKRIAEAKAKAEKEAKEKAEREAEEKRIAEAKARAEKEAKEKAEREAEEKRIAEAKARAEQQAKEKAKREAANQSSMLRGSKWREGAYTIQVLSTKTLKHAEKSAIEIMNINPNIYKPEIVKNLVNNEVRYSIVVGSFKNKSETRGIARSLELDLEIKPWIRNTRGLINNEVK